MRYTAYIFDLDGTLLDTLDDLRASVNYSLRHFAMPERTRDEVREFVGNGVRRLMERAVAGGTDNPLFDEALDMFRRHYAEHSLDHTRPYPGIMDMLATLRHDGKRIAVVSNKFQAATERLCRHFFGDYVEVAIGESEGVRRKPAPDTVVEAMRRMGYAAPAAHGDAVYIGDSDVDIATAKAAGLPCISVLWGFRDKPFLEAHGATTFVTSPEEIVAI